MKTINKKTSRKSSGRKSSASIRSESKEFDDVESLIVLNNLKERKKLDGIDERIKFLKTELKSLLSDMKTDGCSNSFAVKCNSASMLQHDARRNGTKDLETNIKLADNWMNCKETQMSKSREFKPSFNSTPSKFSEWLDKTIEKMNSKSHNKKPNEHAVPPDLEVDLSCEIPAPDSFSSCFSQERVEQLLYKSFLMHNSDVHLPSSEASDAEVNRSTSKRRQHNYKKPRKPQRKGNRERPVQNNLGGCRRSVRSREKRGMPNCTFPHCDIEVINLDSSSGSNKMADKSAVCVDLDVGNYDWSEPFDVNQETQLNSDIQVLEYSEVKEEVNYKGLKSNNPEVTESDISVCNDENGKIEGKKVWECPVCFERSKGQEIVATQCGHVFCRKCLEHHISKLSNSCPSCRGDLRDKPFITLFNF